MQVELVSGLSDTLAGDVLVDLLRPRLTDAVLRLAGKQAEDLDPLFRNTVAATIVRAGKAWNVLPDSCPSGARRPAPARARARTLIAELRAVLPAGRAA